jgi:hypothetical protein
MFNKLTLSDSLMLILRQMLFNFCSYRLSSHDDFIKLELFETADVKFCLFNDFTPVPPKSDWVALEVAVFVSI